MITARLHMAKDDPGAPRVIEIDVAPYELIVPDPSGIGLDLVYHLQSKFIPAATNTADATADYVFHHIA